MFSFPSLRSKNKRNDFDSILPMNNKSKLQTDQTSNILGYIYNTSASIGMAITGTCQVN